MFLNHWSKNNIFLIFWGTILLGIHCAYEQQVSHDNDPKLASVFNQDLYYSEIVDLIPPVSGDDSIVAINSAINRWIKKTLLMGEAEQNIPEDLNIDKLVNDYRESLILHNYEQQLVESNLDTTITPSTLESYYEQYKSQYVLKYSIIRGYLIRVAKSSGLVNKVRAQLKGNEPNIEEVESFINNNPDLDVIVRPYQWIKALDVIDLIAGHTLRVTDMRKSRLIEFNEDKYMIFLKIIERVEDEDIAPLSYVDDQIVRLILHERKINMLENINEQLYEKELRNNNIKIYTQ